MKSSGDHGGWKAAQEPAVGPGSKAGQQCPGLYEQEYGQEIEGSNFPPIAHHLVNYIPRQQPVLVSHPNPKFRTDNNKLERV